MTNLAFPPLPATVESAEQLGERITLLAGQINAAFAAGEISYSKVRAMTRTATPDNEDYLLYIARHGTASHVEQVVRKYRRGCRSNDEKQEQESERQLVYYQDEEGMWVIHARLPPEVGSLVVKAIEAVAVPNQTEAQQSLQEQPSDDKDAKDDSAESFSEAVEQEEPYRFQQLLAHTRADALVGITEHFLATSGKGVFRGLKGSERCQVVLHVDINTLRGKSDVADCAHEHCHLDEKPCRFPGCCESRYVDAQSLPRFIGYHVQHWADGGETSLENLVTLCRYHHRQLHSGVFSISVVGKGADARFVFTTSSGKRIETVFYPQFQKVSAESSATALQALSPGVEPTTAVTRWRGEQCDYEMAVDALLARDAKERFRGIVTECR